MHFKETALFFLIYVVSLSTVVGQEATFYGARNEALAQATVSLSDSWALFYNPAGLKFNQSEVIAGYQSKYTSLGINDGVFGIVFPIKSTALGIGASYFGDQLLSKTKLTTSVAHAIGKTTLGVKANYDQIRIHEIGAKGIFYLSIGGQIQVSKQVTFGMLINNINQAKFDTLSISSPNTSVQVGINYHPHNKLTLLAQVEKNIDNPALLKFALEYSLSKNIHIRTGIIPSPASAFAGIGLQWHIMRLDLSGSYHQSLGWSGGMSIGVPLSLAYED